jgi:hypothetical protein
MRQLRQQIDKQIAQPKKPMSPTSGKTSKQTSAGAAPKKPLTRAEFNQRLMAAGLITHLPDPSLDIDTAGACSRQVVG